MGRVGATLSVSVGGFTLGTEQELGWWRAKQKKIQKTFCLSLENGSNRHQCFTQQVFTLPGLGFCVGFIEPNAPDLVKW